MLPYVTFSVATMDPPAEVARRLSVQVDRARWFRFCAPNLMYTGAVWNAGFKVIPVIRGRNSFLPVICGSFRPQPPGTAVDVTMRLHWAVVAFLCAWCGFAVYGFLIILQAVAAGGASEGELLVVAFMLLFMAGLTAAGFWSEVPRRREEITRILAGPAEPAPDRRV